MAKLFANSEDPDQMPHSVASDLGLLCLPFTLLPVPPTTMGYGRLSPKEADSQWNILFFTSYAVKRKY